MPNSMTIEYPDTLPDRLHQTREEFEREARMAMAVKLFEAKRISSGVAATLAGMDRVSFLLSLHLHKTPMIDIDPEELESDLSNA